MGEVGKMKLYFLEPKWTNNTSVMQPRAKNEPDVVLGDCRMLFGSEKSTPVQSSLGESVQECLSNSDGMTERLWAPTSWDVCPVTCRVGIVIVIAATTAAELSLARVIQGDSMPGAELPTFRIRVIIFVSHSHRDILTQLAIVTGPNASVSMFYASSRKNSYRTQKFTQSLHLRKFQFE